MPYDIELLVQDSIAGRDSVFLRAIAEALVTAQPTRFLGAVAYASRAGAEAVDTEMRRRSSAWVGLTKRWLIGIDFGRTEPAALDFLSALPASDVRIPNGEAVVIRDGFRPIIPFHPKVYVFDQEQNGAPLSIVAGSANLTLSGLRVGTEAGARATWSAPTRAKAAQSLEKAEVEIARLYALFDHAVPYAAIADEYRRRWVASTGKPPPEDSAAGVMAFIEASHVGEDGTLAAQLIAAELLWVEVGELYHNLGPFKPGNQLDLPRGTRTFFGFDGTPVPRNTVLGQVKVRADGFGWTPRSMRFGNNMMDKINLPIPGRDGPGSYDDSILVFRKASMDAATGRPSQQLTVTDGAGLDVMLRSRRVVELTMAGGRKYGLAF